MKIKEIIPVALGEKTPDLLIKNVKLLNVYTGNIEKTNIAILKKRIAGIGNEYNVGKEIFNAKNLYAIPGLIDAHVHIESSMLSPIEFAKMILPNGTTTIIADPHEIANVLGVEGINYMIKATEGIPLNVYFAIPSAVPATFLETSGAILGAEDMVSLLEKYPFRLIALGEVMNYPGVLNCDRELITKIEILRHKYKKIDGHAPGLSGKQLNAYIDAFVRSDHECETKSEALEKLSKGMHIFIREGTAARNLRSLIPAVNILNHFFFSFCTDDRDPEDIYKRGHINQIVKEAIGQGLDPVIAIRMATINTAKYFNLRSMGAISPGYKSDIVLVDNLYDFNILYVIKDSKFVVKDGKIDLKIESVFKDVPTTIGKINITKNYSLKVKNRNKKIRIISIKKFSLITEESIVSPKVSKNEIISDVENDIVKIAVFDRHNASGFSIGFVKGTGIKNGAIATTIGHDSHNLAVLGTNDKDMELAIKRILEINGGIVVIKDKKVISELSLPIAGLMSDETYNTVIKKLQHLKKSIEKLGTKNDVLMNIHFLQLAVIPKLKITDKGLIDVENQKIVDLFVEV
ncbi:adenine deaminase [Thermosipho melanesiensis]|uniref:Adenine deaminase n=2 Tax=Thermosipho melanesiensis TaxID=46541 RepID=ADEC_THEM4|nr:adenine deaminase [Thermosipho melanesiensis]A6LNR9.1 RecName: Full=Adenine deaminase; Short=Adenase; Short=Adenine aminase [Thermosipho melanesiensis BI429]ABR31570.1 adenine deaminase [Thermosipho melanesiensis BI429]APT74603.1 adenine deaminase [Thermosipho melanesiensis]OOC35307.1 adenine deaminase [Thermosipho melanesiensis]OOC35526.1 adenine deaminase [Thermosipho melanesiensis]OOC36562.1 adenine deaminase [Thermosipho melanesiensis]